MNIIIVDDERHSIDRLSNLVEEIDPTGQCTGFFQPDKALEYIKMNKVDIALLDIELFGMDGIQLAKKIKDIYPKINIIFVTGHSKYAMEAHSLHVSGYLLKPVMKKKLEEEFLNLRNLVKKILKSRIQVQTFGNFEIFVEGEAVNFSRSKSKELLAYLVDRKGTGTSTRELAAVLWEDKEYTTSQKSYFQTIVSEMILTLKKYQAQNIVVRKRNNIAVDISKFECDYYQFLNGDVSAINSYMGEYMVNYSWAEFVTGFLDQKSKR